MTPTPNLPSTPPVALAIAMLTRLRRKGARLEPEAAQYRIVYQGERRRTPGFELTEPSRMVATDVVAFAQSRGWLTACGHDNTALRLTETGALASHRGSDPAPISRPPQAATAARARAALSPLARLRQLRDRKGTPLLTGAQVEAGERLAADFLRGQMMPRVTSNWDRAALGYAADRRSGAGVADVSDGAASAQDRVRRALSNVGPEFADLLLDVCCLELGIEVVEKRRVWPAGVGRVVLSLGLTTLMRHYGIVATGAPQGRTAHWRDVDAGSRNHPGAP